MGIGGGNEERRVKKAGRYWQQNFFPSDEERKNAFLSFRQAFIFCMKTVFFEASTWLPVAPESVCAWHENPANLRLISPPWLRVHSVTAEPVARVGETFLVEVSQLGVPLRWRGAWQRVERPHLLEDIGLECPFAAWRHAHAFVGQGQGTRMTDRVECVLPSSWGWIPGASLGVRIVFALMFYGRHRATRRFFAQQSMAHPE